MVKLSKLGRLVEKENQRCDGAKTLLFEFDDVNSFFPTQKEKIVISEIELEKKDEMHLTLVGNDISSEIYNLYEDKNVYLIEFEKLVTDIMKLLEFEEISLVNEFIFLKREKNGELRFSLIRKLKTDVLNKIHEILFRRFHFNLKESFPHITLYKQKENPGIGIDSVEDCEKYKFDCFTDVSKLF